MKPPIGFVTFLAFVPTLALAASAPTASPLSAPAPTREMPKQQTKDEMDELDEVVVQGRRSRAPQRSWDEYQQPFNFLARLVGQFVIAGEVDLLAPGEMNDRRKATGRADCVGFGSAPGVQCELKVRWPESRGTDGEEMPGGISALDPAVLLFGFDPATPGISCVTVDNRGIADTVVGRMTSPNTMLARSRCVAVAGNCERIARITAEPDLKTVRMNIDLVIGEQKTVSFAFVFTRVPGSTSVVYGRKQEKGGKP